MDRLSSLTGHLRHTEGCTESIKILVLVAHDENFVSLCNQITERMGYHTCLHACMLLNGLSLATEELRLSVNLQCHLIAAAAQCQLKIRMSLHCKLAEGLPVSHRDSHRERYRQLVGAVQRAYLVKHLELILHCTLKRAPLKNRHKRLITDTPQKSAKLAHPLVNSAVYVKEKRRALSLGKALQHLVVVINLNVKNSRTAVMVGLAKLCHIRDILHIERHEALFGILNLYGTVHCPIACLPLGKNVFSRHAPDGLQNHIRPKI